MNIERGDKVSTQYGLGEVSDDKVYQGIFSSLFPPKCRVKLDDSGKEKDFEQNAIELLAKKPNLKEVIEAADKIKEKVNEIPNLSTREKGELPNHLEYFKADIQVNNELRKDLGITNLDYVDKILKALKKTDSTALCWDEIESSFKILRWWSRFC